jgi:hypothetical protein
LVLLLLPLLNEEEEEGVAAGESTRKWVPTFVFGGRCVMRLLFLGGLMTTKSFARIAQNSERQNSEKQQQFL